MLVNFYRFFTLVNEQKRQKELQGSVLPKYYAHWQKKNDARVSKILMHEEGAHAKQEVVAGGRLSEEECNVHNPYIAVHTTT